VCGIAGILTFDGAAGQPIFASAVRQMTGLMQRRGPDDEGYFASEDGRLQMGFRRLAILDLTPAGHQPMISGDGGSVIVFNGEIYNHLELRQKLEQSGVRFHSRSDTEVLLEALRRWGVEAIPRLNGMFAFAWYDLKQRRLLLARDHAGIKPLYYGKEARGKGMVFGSQYDVLSHSPWGPLGGVRQDVLRLYLRLHHIPPPYGLLENTYQLEPGAYLVVRADGSIEKRTWWRLPEEPEATLRGEEAVEAVNAAIQNAVRRQRIADVPLGVFLSGGVDSPLVTAVARRQTGPELKAFTIGNPGWWQDESEAASNYGRRLGVDFRLHAASGDDALSRIPEVMAAQYEPFADFSILPTLQVSRFAKSEVTVALSGDGGDELFFGYERPLSLLRNGTDFRFPWLVRRAMYYAGRLGLGPKKSEVITARTPGDYYFGVNCRMSDADLDLIAPELPGLPADFDLYSSGIYRSREQLADYSRRVEFYGQLQRGLKKVDMASMHHSLEVRVPLLDREVVETSLRCDPFDNMRNGTRKAVLRDTLARYVPATEIPTPKRGFAVPLGDWLRGALRPLVEDTLFAAPLYPEGIFDRHGLRRYWEDHLSGRRDCKWGLWTLLALQWWRNSPLLSKKYEGPGPVEKLALRA
jgi:asparagine synthase (glutamine-hydrolysing)